MKLYRKRWWRRGQSTVEYSIIAHVLLFAGGLGLMIPVPDPKDQGMVPLIGWLFLSLNTYYESIYFVLKSGAL